MSSELSAYSAARKCIRAFDLLIKQLQDRGSPEQKESIPPTELQNQCDRLRMWAGSVGALKQGHASLDYRLSNTPPMHVAVLTLLDQLGVFITECTDIVQGKRLPWEKVDKTSLELEIEALADDEDESDRESLESVTELGQNLTEITAIVSDLFKLSFKIRNSSFRSSEQAISKPLLYRDLVVIDGDTKVDIFSLFSTLDHRHVEEFFREIQHATGGTGDLKNGYLAERWANSITKRRRCFAYWRRHAKKLAHEDTATQAYNPTARIPLSPLETPPGTDTRELITAINDSNLEIRTVNQSAISPTEASMYMALPEVDVDSRSSVSYASTAVETPCDGELPPPPSVLPEQGEFLCPYCSVPCPAKHAKPRYWREHISHDLQPYMCTYADCAQGDIMYTSRATWLQHEASVHRQVWLCADHHQTFENEEGLLHHLVSTHPELGEGQIQVLAGSSHANTRDPRSSCPFCLSSGPLEEGELDHHMALHMERLACFAIPRSIVAEDDEFNSGDESNDAQGQRSGGSLKSVSLGSIIEHGPNELEDPLESRQTSSNESDNEDPPGIVRLMVQNLMDRANGKREMPLHEAARDGKLQVVNSLLDNGADINASTRKRATPLHEAAKKGHYETVRLLIDRGADIDTMGHPERETPLHAAAREGHLDIVHLLIDRGANIHASTILYGLPLHAAAKGGNLEIVKFLVAQGTQLDAFHGYAGTPLLEAASGGHTQVARWLLDNGANVMVVANGGRRTPLNQATGHSLDLVRLLIERGADIGPLRGGRVTPGYASSGYTAPEYHLDHWGQVLAGTRSGRAIGTCDAPVFEAVVSHAHEALQLLLDLGASAVVGNCEEMALEMAIRFEDMQSIKLLIANGGGDQSEKPLEIAAHGDQLKVVQYLLSLGVDVNAESLLGTPLMAAARGKGSDLTAIMDLLIQSGAKIDAIGSRGQTALCIAIASGNTERALLLLEKGANPQIPGIGGQTPLSYAAASGLADVVRLLMKKANNIAIADDNGRTPLSYAAESGGEDVVRLILGEYTNNIAIADDNGRTPLSYAAESGGEDVVRLILGEYTNNIAIADKNGRTPLSYAAESGGEDVVRLILGEYTNNIAIADKNGRTPLSYAAESGNESVIRLLLNKYANNIDTADNTGRTPLSYAAEKNTPGVVRQLLTKNIELADANGMTPLLYAVNGKHDPESIVRLLLDKNDNNMEVADRDGRTPLSHAAGKGHEGVTRLLLSKTSKIKTVDKNGKTPRAWAKKKRTHRDRQTYDRIISLLKDAEREFENSHSST